MNVSVVGDAVIGEERVQKGRKDAFLRGACVGNDGGGLKVLKLRSLWAIDRLTYIVVACVDRLASAPLC